MARRSRLGRGRDVGLREVTGDHPGTCGGVRVDVSEQNQVDLDPVCLEVLEDPGRGIRGAGIDQGGPASRDQVRRGLAGAVIQHRVDQDRVAAVAGGGTYCRESASGFAFSPLAAAAACAKDLGRDMEARVHLTLWLL